MSTGRGTRKSTKDPVAAKARAKPRRGASASDPGQLGEGGKGEYTAGERDRMIAVAAYFRAECRGFGPGCELDDWLAAEQEIEHRAEKHP